MGVLDVPTSNSSDHTSTRMNEGTQIQKRAIVVNSNGFSPAKKRLVCKQRKSAKRLQETISGIDSERRLRKERDPNREKSLIEAEKKAKAERKALKELAKSMSK